MADAKPREIREVLFHSPGTQPETRESCGVNLDKMRWPAAGGPGWGVSGPVAHPQSQRPGVSGVSTSPAFDARVSLVQRVRPSSARRVATPLCGAPAALASAGKVRKRSRFSLPTSWGCRRVSLPRGRFGLIPLACHLHHCHDGHPDGLRQVWPDLDDQRQVGGFSGQKRQAKRQVMAGR